MDNLHESLHARKFSLLSNSYVYSIDLDVIKEDGTIIRLREHITDAKLYHLYNDFVFPVLTTTIAINTSLYSSIQKLYKDGKLKFRLNINKIEYETEDGNTILGLPEAFIKDLIVVPIEFPNEPMNYKTDETSTFSHNNNVEVHLELFMKRHLTLNSIPITGSLENTLIKDAVMYCYSYNPSSFSETLIITPVNNTKRIPQLIFPQLNLCKTLKYIQEQFGVYESGIRIYFDYNTDYCIANDFSKNAVVTRGKTEYENVFIYLKEESQYSTMDKLGCYKDKKHQRYVIYGMNTNLIEDNSLSSSEILGSEITTNEIGSSNQYKNAINDLNSIKKKFYYKNNTTNPYVDNSFKANTANNLIRVALELPDIDVSYLTINKKYHINFPDNGKKYNGNYQISSNIISFSPISQGRYFKCKNMCIFNKLVQNVTSIT